VQKKQKKKKGIYASNRRASKSGGEKKAIRLCLKPLEDGSLRLQSGQKWDKEGKEGR